MFMRALLWPAKLQNVMSPVVKFCDSMFFLFNQAWSESQMGWTFSHSIKTCNTLSGTLSQKVQDSVTSAQVIS